MIVVWSIYLYYCCVLVFFLWPGGGWCCKTRSVAFVVVCCCVVIMIYIMWLYIGVYILTFIVYSCRIEGYVVVIFLIIIIYYRLYYFCLSEFDILVVYGDILVARIRLVFGWIDVVIFIDTTMKHGGIFYFFCFSRLFNYYFYVVAWRVISKLYLMLYYLYDY